MHPWGEKMYHKGKVCLREPDSGMEPEKTIDPGDSEVVRKLILSQFAGLTQHTHTYARQFFLP